VRLEPDNSSSSRRRRRSLFEAQINGGKMCFSSPLVTTIQADSSSTTSFAVTLEESSNCWIDLPMIQGTGLFESLFVGDRLRIGQNLNGGGARVVQIRL
jgi:hypothetical protein